MGVVHVLSYLLPFVSVSCSSRQCFPAIIRQRALLGPHRGIVQGPPHPLGRSHGSCAGEQLVLSILSPLYRAHLRRKLCYRYWEQRRCWTLLFCFNWWVKPNPGTDHHGKHNPPLQGSFHTLIKVAIFPTALLVTVSVEMQFFSSASYATLTLHLAHNHDLHH